MIAGQSAADVRQRGRFVEDAVVSARRTPAAPLCCRGGMPAGEDAIAGRRTSFCTSSRTNWRNEATQPRASRLSMIYVTCRTGSPSSTRSMNNWSRMPSTIGRLFSIPMARAIGRNSSRWPRNAFSSDLRRSQGVIVIGRVQSNARHAVLFLAAAHILFPIGQGRVDGPEGAKDARAVRPALLSQACVDSVEVLVQQPFVASRPGLRDAVPAQLRHQRLRAGVLQLAERPLKQVVVGVDDVRRSIDATVALLSRILNQPACPGWMVSLQKLGRRGRATGL